MYFDAYIRPYDVLYNALSGLCDGYFVFIFIIGLHPMLGYIALSGLILFSLIMFNTPHCHRSYKSVKFAILN